MICVDQDRWTNPVFGAQLEASPVFVLGNEAGPAPVGFAPADFDPERAKAGFGEQANGHLIVRLREVQVDPESMEKIPAASRFIVPAPRLLVMARLRPGAIELGRSDIR